MCGIVALISNRSVHHRLVEGLRALEYRGYDSAGIATTDGEELHVVKEVGKVEEAVGDAREMPGNVGIGHCRWATHGAITQHNAHPHTDNSGTLAVIHNGVVENHQELREELEALGYTFKSETDTEVIPVLIEHYYDSTDYLLEAFRKALSRLEGAAAVVLMDVNHPDTLYAARKESPVVIGIGEDENFIASDQFAIQNYTNRIYHLEDYEIAVVHQNRVIYYDFDGQELDRRYTTVKTEPDSADKGEFETFMLKEIYEQPRVIRESFEVDLKDEMLRAKMLGAQQIHIVACGTAYYAGLYGEYVIEDLVDIPTKAFLASEYRYRHCTIDRKTVVIAISQSGETADTLGAIKRAKRNAAYTVALLNVESSSIGRAVDHVIPLKAGPEIGVASTKAYIAMCTQLLRLGLEIRPNKDNFYRKVVRFLMNMPVVLGKHIPEWHAQARDLAEIYGDISNAVFLGRSYNYPTALEGALKLKEISYIHAEGYASGELKHGPIALIDENMLTVAAVTKRSDIYTKVLSNLQEVKAREGRILAVASDNDYELQELADDCFLVPHVVDMCSPIANVVPLQLFAHEVARRLGKDIDKPRNLAKSVTVE